MWHNIVIVINVRWLFHEVIRTVTKGFSSFGGNQFKLIFLIFRIEESRELRQIRHIGYNNKRKVIAPCRTLFSAYHEVIRIPRGAVRIRVEEDKETKNYLGELCVHFIYGIESEGRALTSVWKLVNTTRSRWKPVSCCFTSVIQCVYTRHLLPCLVYINNCWIITSNGILTNNVFFNGISTSRTYACRAAVKFIFQWPLILQLWNRKAMNTTSMETGQLTGLGSFRWPAQYSITRGNQGLGNCYTPWVPPKKISL